MNIKIKLSKAQIDALYRITELYVTMYDPIGFKNLIVKELIIEIYLRMDAMLNNIEQKKFTIRFSGSQAMAFVAFWVSIDLTRTPYENVIINNIIEQIHQSNIYANNQGAAASGS